MVAQSCSHPLKPTILGSNPGPSLNILKSQMALSILELHFLQWISVMLCIHTHEHAHTRTQTHCLSILPMFKEISPLSVLSLLEISQKLISQAFIEAKVQLCDLGFVNQMHSLETLMKQRATEGSMSVLQFLSLCWRQQKPPALGNISHKKGLMHQW